MNRSQADARVKRAKYHTETLGKLKRADLVKAREAASRARKPENRSVIEQMGKLGYVVDLAKAARSAEDDASIYTRKPTASDARKKRKADARKARKAHASAARKAAA